MRDIPGCVDVLTWVGVILLATTTGAAAQVCGDVDGSGTVTVTDGVQVLRAAAKLSSTCATEPAVCDIDGSGSVTVSDGVNVLRLAANLTASGNCVPQVDLVVSSVISLITVAFPELARGGAGSASANTPSAATKDCDFGGTATTDNTDTILRLTLTACVEGSEQLGDRTQLDGTLEVNKQSAVGTSNLEVKDLNSGRLVDFSGEFEAIARAEGGFTVNGGPLRVTITEGHFNLRFDVLAFDANGQRPSGAIEIADDDREFAFASITVTVSSPTTADVHGVFDDGRTADFSLNFLPIP